MKTDIDSKPNISNSYITSVPTLTLPYIDDNGPVLIIFA